MAVSKRTRYEVLRRDSHRCRYCGTSADEGATLTVDHVIPVALGGSDKPDNLVAACKDCNAGKSSASPDATHVAQVAEDAVRWAQALRVAWSQVEDDIATSRRYADAFRAAWNDWTFSGDRLDLPTGWMSTLDHWRKMSVPIDVITNAVDMAMDKVSVRRDQKFRYMCGIVWRTVDETRQRMSMEPTQKTACRHCYGCIHDDECSLLAPEEDGDHICTVCGSRSCLYALGESDGGIAGYGEGWDRGRQHGYQECRDEHLAATRADFVLRQVIDDRSPRAGALGFKDNVASLDEMERLVADLGVSAAVEKAVAARNPWASASIERN